MEKINSIKNICINLAKARFTTNLEWETNSEDYNIFGTLA